MWQQDIISDLSRTSIKHKGTRVSIDINKSYPHVKKSLPILKKNLPSARCYYMNTLALAVKYMDQFESGIDQMENIYDYKNIRFPDSVTLWEYRLPKGGLHGTKKEAIFVLDSEEQVLIWPLVLSPNLKIWLPGMYLVFLSKDRSGQIKIVGPTDVREEEIDDFEDAGRRVTSYVLSFLKILSCRNIIRDTVVPLKKDKKGRVYPYKILKIKSFESYKEDKGSFDDFKFFNDDSSEGRFKQYTPENPLLGKHVGLFWWGSEEDV